MTSSVTGPDIPDGEGSARVSEVSRGHLNNPTGTGPAVPVGLVLLVAATFFMEILDGTILATAAPQIGRSLGVRSSGVGTAITAYLITVAVLIPLSGWVADRLGARTTFVGAILVFTTASVLCAGAQTLTQLVAMRVLQGTGAALMVPVGRLAVLRGVAKQDVIRTMSFLIWPGLVAPIIAPVAGGLLTTYASWRWIFLINAPLGIVAIGVAWRRMPRGGGERAVRLDWRGFLGCAAAIGSAASLADAAGDPDVDVRWTLLLAATAVAAGTVTVRYFAAASRPLLDLSVLRVASFRASHAGGSLFRIAIHAVPFLLALWLQDQFGWSAAHAGTLVLFLFVGNLAVKPLTTPMLQHLGFRPTLVIATAGAAVSVAACGLLGATTPGWLLAAVVAAGGGFRSIGFSAYNTLAFADVEGPALSGANTLAATVQQLAQAFGVALGVLVLRLGEVFYEGEGAYRLAFALVGSLLVVACVAAARLPQGLGRELRSRR